ncbi:hypothetical protein BDV95DRAFT_596440 [Massariosphaeria phaeospora]|uniref:Uncharacterized protein n=1 Tax=Massariosphaeria phaeospora TaxID=100035 RepID=A0A7C8M7B9_9PLEO|nr:hypothetical protein BDV95DRAFT_596440 [Massariosphaeria phaeospora]
MDPHRSQLAVAAMPSEPSLLELGLQHRTSKLEHGIDHRLGFNPVLEDLLADLRCAPTITEDRKMREEWTQKLNELGSRHETAMQEAEKQLQAAIQENEKLTNEHQRTLANFNQYLTDISLQVCNRDLPSQDSLEARLRDFVSALTSYSGNTAAQDRLSALQPHDEMHQRIAAALLEASGQLSMQLPGGEIETQAVAFINAVNSRFHQDGISREKDNAAHSGLIRNLNNALTIASSEFADELPALPIEQRLTAFIKAASKHTTDKLDHTLRPISQQLDSAASDLHISLWDASIDSKLSTVIRAFNENSHQHQAFTARLEQAVMAGSTRFSVQVKGDALETRLTNLFDGVEARSARALEDALRQLNDEHSLVIRTFGNTVDTASKKLSVPFDVNQHLRSELQWTFNEVVELSKQILVGQGLGDDHIKPVDFAADYLDDATGLVRRADWRKWFLETGSQIETQLDARSELQQIAASSDRQQLVGLLVDYNRTMFKSVSSDEFEWQPIDSFTPAPDLLEWMEARMSEWVSLLIESDNDVDRRYFRAIDEIMTKFHSYMVEVNDVLHESRTGTTIRAFRFAHPTNIVGFEKDAAEISRYLLGVTDLLYHGACNMRLQVHELADIGSTIVDERDSLRALVINLAAALKESHDRLDCHISR